MAINQRNDDKGRNGGKMPLQGPSGGESPWARKSPANQYPGAKAYAGRDYPMRPVGGTPSGNPSKTPRP